MSKPTNDKYYTSPVFVEQCLKNIDFNEYDLIFEPSAGCGSFLTRLPKNKTIGIDVSPDLDNIIELDFYSIPKVITALDLQTNPDKKYLSIGNPPFGYAAQMAIDFFNGCAMFSDTIAFIVPRTFRKTSVTNQLDLSFHKSFELIAPKNSFLIMDPTSETLTSEYDVPCVFQIWNKGDSKREKIKSITKCEHFDFVDKREDADFALRRVGVAAGKTFDKDNVAKQSHHFIKSKLKNCRQIFDSIEWDENSAKYDTAGNPSLSKEELILAFIKQMNK